MLSFKGTIDLKWNRIKKVDGYIYNKFIYIHTRTASFLNKVDVYIYNIFVYIHARTANFLNYIFTYSRIQLWTNFKWILSVLLITRSMVNTSIMEIRFFIFYFLYDMKKNHFSNTMFLTIRSSFNFIQLSLFIYYNMFMS